VLGGTLVDGGGSVKPTSIFQLHRFTQDLLKGERVHSGPFQEMLQPVRGQWEELLDISMGLQEDFRTWEGKAFYYSDILTVEGVACGGDEGPGATGGKGSRSTWARQLERRSLLGWGVLCPQPQGDRIRSLKAREKLKDDLILPLPFTVGKT